MPAAPDRELIDPGDPRRGRLRVRVAMTKRSMICRLAGDAQVGGKPRSCSALGKANGAPRSPPLQLQAISRITHL